MKRLLNKVLFLFLLLPILVFADIVEISSWAELQAINSALSGDYLLVNNLDKDSYEYEDYASATANSGEGWLPIGDNANRFTGSFNGGNKSISDVVVNRTTTDRVGLFGVSGTGSTIEKLKVLDVDIKGKHYVGGLAGFNKGSITNSYATGSVTGAGNYVGGLVGSNYGGGIINSYATGSVSGTENTVDTVGGLVGANYGDITNSYATGSVTGAGNTVGGLVGSNYSDIANSYATGSVTGTGYYVGGLVGTNYGSITDCFWDIETSGQSTSDGGTGKTTAEMKNIQTFLDVGWSIATVGEYDDEIWKIDDGKTYPMLYWEKYGETKKKRLDSFFMFLQ